MYNKDALKQLLLQAQNKEHMQAGTAMTDLDEFVGGLNEEERKALGQDEDFNHVKAVYLESFIMYQAVASEDGRRFATGPGRRMAQELLDCARAAKRNAHRPPQPDMSHLQKQMEEQSAMMAKVLEANATLTQEVATLKKDLGEADAGQSAE